LRGGGGGGGGGGGKQESTTDFKMQSHRVNCKPVSKSISKPSTILPLTVISSVEQFTEKKELPVNYIKHKFSGNL